MPLADEQFSYRGLTFGVGCDILVNRHEGLEGFEVRSSDADLPRGDGSIRGLDYVAPRTIAFELVLHEFTDNGGEDYEALWSDVRRAFRPSREADSPLTFKRPGQPEQMISCRPVQLVRAEEFKRYNRFGYPPIVLRAADPRIYSAARKSANAVVYATSGGGTDFAMNFSADFGAGTQTELVVQNDGDAEAYPLVRFYGPASGTCDGVTLTNTATGQVLEIATTVTSGQILSADMEAAVTGADRLVISLDGSSRYGDWVLPRDAFYLAPGSNTLRFEVDGTSDDMICNVQWRDTSLG